MLYLYKPYITKLTLALITVLGAGLLFLQTAHAQDPAKGLYVTNNTSHTLWVAFSHTKSRPVGHNLPAISTENCVKGFTTIEPGDTRQVRSSVDDGDHFFGIHVHDEKWNVYVTKNVQSYWIGKKGARFSYCDPDLAGKTEQELNQIYNRSYFSTFEVEGSSYYYAVWEEQIITVNGFVYVQNNCQHPIRLALAWPDPNKSGNFSMDKWWSFSGNEGYYPSSNGNKIVAQGYDYEHAQVFYYAEATDGSGKVMQGDIEVDFSGQRLQTRPQILSREAGGVFELRIPYTCD